jgi:hypothetical protein
MRAFIKRFLMHYGTLSLGAVSRPAQCVACPHPRGVAARPVETGYQPKLHRIKAGNEEDGNSGRRRDRGPRRPQR